MVGDALNPDISVIRQIYRDRLIDMFISTIGPKKRMFIDKQPIKDYVGL